MWKLRPTPCWRRNGRWAGGARRRSLRERNDGGRWVMSEKQTGGVTTVTDRDRRIPVPTKPLVERGRGFSARLQDASLWDLVQFECLRRSSRVVRVASRGQVGFVFFRD